MRLEDFRKQYPQYNDVSDEDLAKGLHRRFYSDIPFEDFSQRVGFAPETGITRRIFGDIPVGIAQGATTGVRMISDAFGAGNPVSESLKGVEEYLGGLLSAQATNNLDAMAKIMKEAEDKGVLEQVKAGFQGLAAAPVEVVSQFLGTAAPTILAGVGGALAKVGATGIGAIQAGTGATMGAGLIKGNIYEVVKEELIKAKVDPEIAEERATFAQNYTGENWDQILLGTGLGGAAALGPLERIFARVPAIPTGLAAKNMVARGVTAGVMEGAPEFTQAFQEQVASNIALQREGFDVPTYRGAVANATLEGLAGFGVGAPIGMISRRQRAEQEPPPQPPGQPPVEPPVGQPPAEPGQPPAEPPPGTPPVQPPGLMPGMVEAEPELSPEEEAELQQQIAAAPQAAPPAIPAPPTPEVAAQVQALNTQLAKIQAKRLDPMLSPSDPVFQELDQQEAQINQQIQALARPQEPLVAKQQISAPETVAKQQIPPPETVAKQQIETVAKQQIEPTIEDQVRAQKSEERRERQAEQEAKKGEFVLQNRDRAGTASLQQMQGIASAPDYGRAGFSRTPDGAPIVAFGDFKPEQLGREDVVTTARGRKIPVQYAVMEADEILTSNDFDGRSNPQYGDKDVSGTRAIAGNGRVTGIREAFKYPGRTEKYVEGMLADTSLHGVDQDVIADIKKPILVRIMPKEGLTRDIGDELNMSGMLELSPVEQSRNDLNRVDFDALAFDEDGEITNASLGQFINAQPVEERAKLVDRGLPTRQARQRLENAIFARAYNDDDLIAMFAQADDAEARLVINALAQIAPQMAKLEGAGDLDIRDIVTDAAKIIISGKRRGLKLKEIASQVDMTVDPDTRIIVDLFAQNTRSNKQAIEALNNAADIAYRESIRPEEGLFGAEPRMERREVVEQMRRGYEPGRTQDVAQAQRPGVAPSDVERQAEPSPAAVPPADQGFQLTGQTPEELAELERKEKTGQAQREQEEREAKAIAEREREIFTLSRTRAEPTPTAPPLKPPADMFGATGMADQPPRTAVEAPATPIEEAAKPATEAEESFKETVEIYVNDISSGAPTSTAATDYDEAANTITYVETWEGDFRTPPEELDELISGANKSDTAKGAGYSILVKDTPTESVVMTFQPRGRKPTDKYVDVFMSVQKITKEKPERTYKEEVEFFLNKKKLNDPETSKKIQESRGVSKPVADSYVRALRQRVEEQAKWTYGLGSEQAYKQANDEVNKIENRIRGIEKRKETKQEKAAVPTPGDIIESIDLPDNMQVRILKAADGFSVQMYDKDSDNVVDGSVTIFKDSVFDEDAFKIAKEYADNLAEEVRQEAKEAEEVATEAKKEPVAGPTVTGMQAEIDRLKAEAKAKGVEPAPSAAVPDTTKQKQAEKKKKEEAKKLKQATRSEIEYARFDDIDTNPIQATPEQLKMAEELAAQVKGELVFFDKDLNLGLVVVPNNLGFEDYFPIHGGKISKVDVADYTGLSTADKSFLSRISRSIRVFRDSGRGMFPNIEIDMPDDRQTDLFGSTSEAKQISEAMEPKAKKLPPGRSPELTAAAQAVKAGTMTAEEFNKLVDTYKPIPVYAEPLKPATAEQVFDALDVKKREQINPPIPNGTKVGLRLDIPAFNRKGVFVVSIHQKRTASAPGKVIGYGSVAKAKNVTFGVGNQLKALDIAAGEAKDALQTIEGEYVNITPEQAFAEAQRAIKDPSYVQIGIDPTRHAYFYDRSTTLPVVSAEEVIQIGNMILAKKPVFGKKADFIYNIESAPTPAMTKDDLKSFLEELRKEDDAKREVERQEKIAYYAGIRRKEVALQKKVREYGSTIDIQRQLNNLNRLARELKEDIDLDKSPVYTAENFLRQARAALEGRTPYKEPAISADVFAVIQAMYMDDPKLLEGLRLSIKPEFTPEEALLRSAYGYPRASGAFESFRRVVYLYTGTKGVDNPSTIRHEITHTLEQMMTPAQRQAVISSYFNAVEKAAKKHKDARSQEFFEKLGEFLNNPTPKTKSALNKALPSYDFYQYVNPSEYWAVNAEKLMAQRLGPAWDRFKKVVRKMFEKLKDIFGFDNRYAVHQVFDQVMGGSKQRLTKDMLADFIFSSGERFDFLENIEDDAELMRRSGRGDTPMLDVSPMKRIMIRGATNAKESFKEMVENPSEILRMTFNPINRGIIYLRNKNVWFGTGLNEADRIRYSGQVRTAEGIATASLALDNMIRSGNIATQVLFRGGIEYNPDTLMFGAVEKEQNMEKVYRAEAALKKKLGDQLGTNISNGYFEAKRSRNIKEEVVSRQQTLETLQELVNDKVAEMKALDADPNATEKEINKVNKELRSLFREFQDAKKDLETIKKIAEDKVSMSEEMIEEFISREKVHPELKEMLDNFTAVNQNMLRFWRQVGLLSENRYNTLSRIKDYVPWYRIMNDEEDVHSPLQATTRSATNIGKEKLFGPGKPSVINDFIIEENQDVFKIQPGRVNVVKLEGKKLKPEDYEVTPKGEVTLKVPYKPGDVLIVETQREIENMIDNMTRNVMRMTMNGLRQYAAQRIVSEYATRDSDGKIMTFNKTDADKGRFDFIRDGRRTVVEIQDPLLAEAVLGMESVGMQMWKPLAAAANFTRRTITLSPVFQLKQVFKDAPTAALVTGVKNPAALVGGVYKGFIDAVRDSDPAAGILRSVGIGGFYSPARTPEADVKRQIGIINNSTYDYVLKALDHFGDSSDMAQRIAIYNRVMAETGDEALAMYQAANVINFLRHGSGQVAQALVKTVPFLNAYAQSIDVLYNALIGGGLRGLDRKKAMQRLFITGSLLAGTTLLYAMLVGDDEDYMKMDDQSKVRSYIIPGTDVVLPMNTSAAFFFKAIPELTYNAIVSQGTENAMDEKRVRRALKEAAVDLLLGPTPVPSAVKPVVEISLNYDFFTSRPVVPAGLKDLDAYQQYDMRTSEAAKSLSALTGGKENRLINPVEADHLIRGIFGTAGGMVAWSSNLIGEASEVRPAMGLKEMPITGAFLRPEVPRGREDLFYALKESTDRKFKTFNRLADRDIKEAEEYLQKHPNLISFYDYTSEMDTQLKELNAAIRFIAETTDRSYTPEMKRKEIQELLNLKQDILEGVEMFRREAYSE
jgi:hypothetical protein